MLRFKPPQDRDIAHGVFSAEPLIKRLQIIMPSGREGGPVLAGIGQAEKEGRAGILVERSNNLQEPLSGLGREPSFPPHPRFRRYRRRILALQFTH